MQLLPRDRYCQIVVLVFLCLFAITSYRPPYLGDFLLQHVLTNVYGVALSASIGDLPDTAGLQTQPARHGRAAQAEHPAGACSLS